MPKRFEPSNNWTREERLAIVHIIADLLLDGRGSMSYAEQRKRLEIIEKVLIEHGAVLERKRGRILEAMQWPR